MVKHPSGGGTIKPKSVSTKKVNKMAKSKASSHRGGSPFVKSLYNYKAPDPVSVLTSGGLSEWSTVGTGVTRGDTDTTSTGVTRGDTDTTSFWSDDEFDFGNEYCGSRSEQLRESCPSNRTPPLFCPRPSGEVLKLVPRSKPELPRSPSVDALAELLGHRDKKICLLPPNIPSSSSSSDESDIIVDILTSTVIQGGNKKMDTEDISVISTRLPVDGDVYNQSDSSDSELANASTSMPESGGTGVVQETVDVEANLLVKDVEPTKLQDDASNDSTSKSQIQHVYNIDHKSGENSLCQSPEDVDKNEFSTEKLDFQKNGSYEMSKEDVSANINKELSSLSPPGSSSVHISSVSEDTSGEIFSAVVHKNQVGVVVPYRESYTPSSLRGKNLRRKKLKLAHPTKVPASISFHLFSPEQYYESKSRSERLFDEFIEEEDVRKDLFD